MSQPKKGKWKVRAFYDAKYKESGVYVTREGYMEDSEGWKAVDERYSIGEQFEARAEYNIAKMHAKLFATALNKAEKKNETSS